MLKTIKEVFVENLRRLRGNRTQAEIAELAGIPLRSYQNTEINGAIPQGPNLAAIAKALGVPETALFFDETLIDRSPGIPRDLLRLLAAANEHELGTIRRLLESGNNLSGDFDAEDDELGEKRGNKA